MSMVAPDVSVQLVSRLTEFCFHNCGASKPRNSRIATRWRPPSAGFYKVHVDGAFSQSTRSGGWRFLIRDHTGKFLAGRAGLVRSLISAKHVELLAIGMLQSS